ncbi:MAG: bifunctional riboflavin kinase/FAD synthetase [Clostridia bacterium]|nr:bifunctional riboflavin kinase/FAD synthetase [Clostridia bacterium]
METYTTPKTKPGASCVLALGCFDGIHVGHKAVIDTARAKACELGVSSAVWTFLEPPKNFFAPNSAPTITDFKEKQRLISDLRIDFFFCIPFDSEIRDTSPEDFLEKYILSVMDVKHIVCGFNYRFGKNAIGDTKLLSDFCSSKNIGLTVLPPTTVDGKIVSSSLIRSAVEKGEVEYAAKLLGRYYSITFIVTDGQALARKLGFPTANGSLPDNKLLIRKGVYASRVFFSGEYKYGITNVGIRPTVNGKRLCMETHLFDFSGDLYGQELTVEFLSFIRDEVKFDSLDAMSEQIHKDIEKAKKLIK